MRTDALGLTTGMIKYAGGSNTFQCNAELTGKNNCYISGARHERNSVEKQQCRGGCLPFLVRRVHTVLQVGWRMCVRWSLMSMTKWVEDLVY